MPRAVSLALVMVFGASTAAADPNADKAHKLWQDAIAYRKTLRNGRVTATLVVKKSPHGPSYEDSRRFSTVFDGVKSRTVSTWVQPDGREDTYYALYDGETWATTDRTDMPVRVWKHGPNPPDDYHLAAPQRLGLVEDCFQSLVGRSLDDAEPDRTKFRLVAVEERAAADGPSVTVRYAANSGACECAYVFAVNKGPSLASSTSWVGLKSGGRLETAVTANNVQWPGGYFPASVRFATMLKGEPHRDETVTIDQAAFNVNLPAGTFTLAGLSLPRGRELMVGDAKKEWTGDRVGDSIPVVTAIRATGGRWDGLWPYAVAGAGAVFGGAVVAVVRSRRRL